MNETAASEPIKYGFRFSITSEHQRWCSDERIDLLNFDRAVESLRKALVEHGQPGADTDYSVSLVIYPKETNQ